MTDQKKRILVCDDNVHDLGRLATWLHEDYIHVMASDLARAQYQFQRQKFALVVADLSGSDAWQWLTMIELTGQLVLHVSKWEVTGRPHLIKPARKNFETLREPFLEKVKSLLGNHNA